MMLCLAWSVVLPVQAQPSLVLKASDTKVNIVPYVEVLTDPTRKLTLETILAEPQNYPFQSPQNSSDNVLNFGLSHAAHWVRISLSHQPGVIDRWVLEIPYVAIDDLELFAPSGQLWVSGTMRDFRERQIFTRVHAFYVDVSLQPSTYYLRVQSTYPLTIPLELMRTDVFGQEQLIDTMLQFLYYGGLLSLFFYNLVIYFTTQERRYLLYCLFAASVLLAMFAGNGYGRLFLWSNAPYFDRVAQGVFVGLATGFALLFSCTALELKQRASKVYWALLLATSISFSVSVGFLFSIFIQMSIGWLYLLQFTVSSLGIILCITVATYLLSRGVNEAKYFIFSWGFLCIGSVAGSLRALEVLPSNLFTLYAVQITTGIEAILFSFALADRLRSERTARELAQKSLLASQRETVQALKISEAALENEVSIRTQELRASLLNEQRLREQYVRFGAMIAHEFRNPLNVIEAQNTLLELEPDAGSAKVLKRVGVIRSAVVRLSTMFDQWLQSDRLSQVFAKASLLPIDLKRLLDDAVSTSQSYHVEYSFITEYPDSSLMINADYGLLRIAILNLIDNACKYSKQGLNACKASGKTFAVIDRQSSYRGIDPNMRAAISIANVLTKSSFSGASRTSSDWRVVVVGKCQ
jgi:two-component system, sensor histidine kinase LadS